MNKRDVKSMLKRVLSLLLINVMLIGLFAPYSTVFAATSTVSFTTDVTSISTGDIVPIKIEITGGNPVVTIDGYLDFDPSLFEFYSIEVNPSLMQGQIPTYQETDQYIYITAQNPCVNSYLATINLKAKTDINSFTVGINECFATWQDATPEDLGDVSSIINIGTAPAAHTVTYDYATNGGISSTASSTPIEVAENSAIDLTPSATKTDWNFVGWNTDSSATTGLSSLNMETSDVTLYAIFSKELTATCHYYDVSATQRTKTVTGTIYNNEASVNINLPTITEEYMDGMGNLWTRNGWTTSTSATETSGVAEGSSVTINSNIDYYMLYKRNINIRYHVNGGNSTAPSTQNGVIKANASDINTIEGANITISNEKPSRDGYTFKNKWNTTTSASGTSYSSNTTYNFTEDTTLYAEWVTNTNTPYIVEHYKQNADGTYNAVADETESLTGTTGHTATAVAKTYNGYTEDASNSNRVASGVITGDGSLILKLYYKANTDIVYTVEHYIEQVDGSYTIDSALTENLTGITGANVTATPKSITGYTENTTHADRKASGVIAGDGSLVLKLYYSANTNTAYTIEHYKEQADGSYVIDNTLTENLTGATGFTATASAKTIEGYTENTTHADRKASGVIAGDGSLVLKLYYTLNEYTVTFKNEDGTILNTQTIKHGEAATAPADPSKPADAEYTYTFAGWDKSFDNITSDLEVIATYTRTKNKYTVTFKDEAGNILDTQTVEYGKGAIYGGITPTKPATAEYTYTFVGWIDGQGNDVDVNNVMGNKEVYPKFSETKNKYIVTLDVNGGDALTPNTIEVEYGETYGTLPTPTKEGYNFLGWFDALQGGNKVENTDIVTASHTLYANWEIKKYTVTLDVNGGDTLTPNTIEVEHNGTYGALPTPTRTGYTFLGWFDSATNGNKIESTTPIVVAKNHVLYANWEVVKYTVEFIGKDTSGNDAVIATVQVPHGENITSNLLTSQGIDINDLKKDINTQQYHYTFKDWETSKFYNVTSDTQIQITYNATVNSYTITFYDEDKTTVLGIATAEYGNTADDTRINPIKAEDNVYTYTFDKWVDLSGNVDDLSNVLADRNVYATYRSSYREYSVNFVDEDGNNISTKTDYHYGDSIVIPSNPTKPATDEFTYIFAGWTDNSGNVVDLSLETVTENTTYTAKYDKEINQYTITFYDEDKTTLLGTSTVEYGTSATYPNSTPIKADANGYTYTFAGWVDSLDNTDDLSNVVENRDVFATYTSEAISYTITYIDTNDASNSNPTTYTVEDADITLLPLGQKAGMTFSGWYTDTNYTTQITSIITSNMENITVYAKWDIESLMYFVKVDSTVDNTDPSVVIYDDFDDAKAYVDTLFDNGNGTALGVYDLNNDLVYFPEVKEEDPSPDSSKVQYFVKISLDDENTEDNTFDKFTDAKAEADRLFEQGVQVKVYDQNGEIIYEPQEGLYLKSQKYKIGENKVDEFEDGDIYLYRVSPNTKLSDFIANCETNGVITVYKQDGNILGNNEIIGTGMTLLDELNGETIKLTIGVTGDLDGNGESDITDLVKVRRHIQEIELQIGIFAKAGDINEDNSIDITDLVKIRRHIQEIEYII